MTTRKELLNYAKKICLPAWERVANRCLKKTPPQRVNSVYGANMMENIFRPMWGMGGVLRDEEMYIKIDGKKTDVCEWIRTVMLEGLDQGSPYSFERHKTISGPGGYANQIKTELPGWAMSVFFAREKLWEPYTQEEKDRIGKWVYEISCQGYDVAFANNHIWFALLVLVVLKRLGYKGERTDSILQEGLGRLDNFYMGAGWHHDGYFPRFDYYLSWSLHCYPLLWTLIEDESFEGYAGRKALYLQRTEEFLDYYAHYFDSTGCHVATGRSLTYRFAASAIYPIAALAGCKMDYGLGKSILLKNTGWFEKNAEVGHDDVLTPGFGYAAPAFVDGYSCDGSAYWCSKAFVALAMDEGHPFWAAEAKPLKLEEGEYVKRSGHEKINILVEGLKNSGVTLYNNTAHLLVGDRLTSFFNDVAGSYAKFAYNSRAGFGLSTRDLVSLDNSIGLITREHTMQSHRNGFVDLGERDGWLVSEHKPFDNDPGTKITTWMRILGKGFHARVHEVVLGFPYYVREGGFSIGHWDDNVRVDVFEGATKGVAFYNLSAGPAAGGVSAVWSSAASIELSFDVTAVHPGMHLLAPAARYPRYTTKEVLAPGKYFFASVFYFSSKMELPEETYEIKILIKDGKNENMAGLDGNSLCLKGAMVKLTKK